jgi:hypothetical protein
MKSQSRAASQLAHRAVTPRAIGDMVASEFCALVPPMDGLEKIAYTLLGFVSLLYLVVMVAGLIAAFPWGIVGLIAIVGIGLLLIKVIRERIRNREDDYYSKNVDQ